MSRKRQREQAFKLLYELNMKKEEETSCIAQYLQRENIEEAYVSEVLHLYLQNREEIVSVLKQSSKKWDINRIMKLDFSILALALTEILYMKEIPIKVSINEAVDLAKKYSGEDSYKFVNGILKQATIELGEEIK